MRLDVRAVAFEDAIRNMDRSATSRDAQKARQQRRRGRAVDVVVAEDRDRLAAQHRVGDARRRLLHRRSACRDPASAASRSDRERPRRRPPRRRARRERAPAVPARRALRDRKRPRTAARSSSRSRQARPERTSPRRERGALRMGHWPKPSAARHCQESVAIRNSEELTILDEAGAVRHRVVKRARGLIVFLGQPVDAARAPFPRRPRPPRSARVRPRVARVGRDEQVLQIAIIADRPERAMEEIVHDADHAARRYRRRARTSARPDRGGGPR